tara:strand:- start:543 stop:1391 length:849 start_codon:yes stop_codon:yes gene_type:complete
MNLKETIERLDRKLEEVYDNPRHLKTASNSVFASAVRQDIDVNEFLDSVENGTAFDIKEFSFASKGNFLDFIQPKYKVMGQSLIDITAGGNGGMASIGRGEFAISFLSNLKAKITKSGCGDLEFNGKYEEVKHNGGKVSVDDKAGNEIFRTFIKLVEEYDPKFLKKKDYLPNRKTDEKLYSLEEKKKLNALYWEAITKTPQTLMTDDEFFKKCFKRAFERLFEKIDTLLVLNEKNNFIRFFNATSAIKFYSDRISIVRGNFEIRNYQNNAVSFYLGLKEVTA